jgi:hypothetical protein
MGQPLENYVDSYYTTDMKIWSLLLLTRPNGSNQIMVSLCIHHF